MPHRLLDQILPILSAVRDDKEKLQRILAFLESEILPEIQEPINAELNKNEQRLSPGQGLVE